MDVVRIVNAFSEAALDHGRWSRAMEIASESAGAFGAALFSIEGRFPALIHTDSLGESVEHYIRDGWISKDERYKAYPAVKNRGVGTDFDFTCIDSMEHHPYYQDFLAKNNLKWFAGVGMSYGTERWCLSLNRSTLQQPFSLQEIELLTLLSQKLSGPVAVACALGFSRIDAALSAFEISGTPVVMFNQEGLVSRMNHSAERFFRIGLQLKEKKIFSPDKNANSNLDRALRNLIANQNTNCPSSPIIMPRRNMRPILIHLTTLPNMSRDIFGGCRAVGILSDLMSDKSIKTNDLMAVFNLTYAEANVAARICEGVKLENIAAEANISYETARNHLKSVFAKTCVKRQPELVALIGRMRAPLAQS